jgi:hypothetical protein
MKFFKLSFALVREVGEAGITVSVSRKAVVTLVALNLKTLNNILSSLSISQ